MFFLSHFFFMLMARATLIENVHQLVSAEVVGCNSTASVAAGIFLVVHWLASARRAAVLPRI